MNHSQIFALRELKQNVCNIYFIWYDNIIQYHNAIKYNEGIELNDIKYKSLYIVIKLISQHKLKRSYIVI
jgi:hypothetical protein